MITLSRRSYRMWQRNRDVFFRVWRTEVPGMVAEPLMVLVAMGFGLGAFVGTVNGGRYIEFIGPGIIASYAMFSASFECTYGSYVRMHYQRTYDAIVSTPLNLEDVIAGEIFWGATRSILTACVVLAVVAAFGLVSSLWALLIPFVAAIQGLVFASIAMFYTSLATSINSFNYFFTLIITPMFFFSGVFFPLDAFPPLVQRLSWMVPLTSATKLTRGLASGQVDTGLWVPLAILIGLAMAFFWLAMSNMRRRLVK